MNLRVIIGGIAIMGIGLIFFLPGLVLDEGTALEKITGQVVADNIKKVNSLVTLSAIPYVFLLIGLQTIIVGFMVGYR